MFTTTDRVVILFDDPKESWKLNLKQTDKKRYLKNYPKLTLNTESMVHDWEWIMKQPENKNTLKKLFGQTLLEKAAVLLDFEQELYINGIEDHGIVQRITKSLEGIHIETMETEWSQMLGESDTKIFHLLELFSK